MRLNYKIVITKLIAILALVGCNKDKNPLDNMLFRPSNNSVSFSSTPDNWGATKGDVINSNNFTNFDVYAYYTKDKEFSNTDVELATFMYNQKVEREKVEGATAEDYTFTDWSYSPTKYWPNNDNDKISFCAFSPFNAISKPVIEKGEKYPTFSYTHTSISGETKDLLYSTNFNKTKPTDGSGVEFDMQRLMSRVNLYGGCINKPSSADFKKVGELDVEYYIFSIAFFGVRHRADYKYDETTSGYTWEINTEEDKIKSYSAVEGNILKSVENINNAIPPINAADITNNDLSNYKDLCVENKGILFLPQDANDMTLQVFIAKRYKKYVYDEIDNKYTTEVIKAEDTDEEVAEDDSGNAIFETVFESSKDLKVPTPDSKGFKSGDWINMYFTFDASRVSEDYIVPMTLFAKPYEWIEADVPSDIHRNIYIYSSKQDFIVEPEDNKADFMVCTNYSYSLRSPHSRKELDGTITTSRGFLFYSNDFSGDGTEECFVPTIIYTDPTDNKQYAIEYVKDASGNYEFEYNAEDEVYHQLYYKREITFDDTQYQYPNGEVNASTTKNKFNYNGKEIDLSEFGIDNDSEVINYKILIPKIKNNKGTVIFENYYFDFSITKSTRKKEGLYISSAIDKDGKDNSYGVNKKDTDPVYKISLSVDHNHLTTFGSFHDVIGVEMISNGGGMLTQRFKVSVEPAQTN